MRVEEAIDVCERWFAHLERQEAKTHEMQLLAALARSGPEGQAEARKRMRIIDRSTVTVFDGATLLPAVKTLIKAVNPNA